jgi:hypothetical protein
MLQRRGSYEFWTPPNPRDFRYGECGGRLELVSSSELAFSVYSSSVIEINSENVDIASLNICDVSNDLIDNQGDDTGFGPATLARTYAYVSNSSASSNPNSLRLSASAPVNFGGFRYLASSGNGSNWRFVGWVGTLGSPSVQFRDDQTARLVVNAYNRLRKSLFLCPGYNDNNTETTYTTTNATWTGIGVTASLTDTVAFVSDGENAVEFQAAISPHTSAANWRAGIGINTTIATARTTILGSCGLRTALANQSSSCSYGAVYSSGFYFAALSSYTAAAACVVHADYARNGSTADPFATYLQGSVLA